jgi:hypothetical protein
VGSPNVAAINSTATMAPNAASVRPDLCEIMGSRYPVWSGADDRQRSKSGSGFRTHVERVRPLVRRCERRCAKASASDSSGQLPVG